MTSSVKPVPPDKFALGFFALLQERPEDSTREQMEAEANMMLEEIFRDSRELIEHFWPRFFALIDLLAHPDVQAFTSAHPVKENTRIHPALMTAASEIKINRNGRFPRRKLLDYAEELSRTEFTDWSWSEDQAGENST